MVSDMEEWLGKTMTIDKVNQKQYFYSLVRKDFCMWISKKMWGSLNRRIVELSSEVEALVSLHTDRTCIWFVSNSGRVKGLDHTKALPQLNMSVKTETIPDLTVEELAKYVVDGTPIKRKKEIDVEYK